MVLVGILSGYGRDLMRSWDRPVDCVYFLPRLRQWFVEATLYPFIGGNTVRPARLPGAGAAARASTTSCPMRRRPTRMSAVGKLSFNCHAPAWRPLWM